MCGFMSPKDMSYIKLPKISLLSVYFVQIPKNDKIFPNLLYIGKF